uniref:G-protein coupled receptors family 2 profile 2 domain-containing protein n=1 Tax=Sphaeramia orbicularis TaxID=375764 RepID=A0A673AM58_9TELE
MSSLLTINVLLIFLLYLFTRKLHCTRNYIHMNLFVSFILRAVAVISKEIILYVMYSNLPKDDPGWKQYSSSAIVLMCRFSKVCMEYFVACNYFWLLVEAIFLHTLLFTAVLTKRRKGDCFWFGLFLCFFVNTLAAKLLVEFIPNWVYRLPVIQNRSHYILGKLGQSSHFL